MSFILHKDEARHRPASQLCSMLQFVTCPQQTNGIDCGLFAVGTILHLLSNKEVNGDIFNQEHVSHLRKLLATYFS
jgi:Ulp1 family protease